jgi:hypothetical protein
MDAQELRNLQEAYLEVVDNQQLDEGYKKQDLMRQVDQSNRLKSKGLIGRMHKKVDRNTSHKKEYSERDARYNKERPEDQKRSKLVSDNNAKKKSFPNRLTRSDKQGIRDSYDYYDIILSHLLDEGYAETQEQAQVIMVNMSEDWRESIVEEVLDEAEGSYGQTPKASAAYTALHTGKGKSKTKSLALKHAIRAAGDDNSNKPSPKRSKMTQSDRDYHRGQSENGGEDREGIDFDEFDTGASGPGGKPKGKKLERQRKTGVSVD